MRLSNLQKQILTECYFASGKISSEEIVKSYRDGGTKNIRGIVIKSLERLIKKELLSAVAKKTSQKLFIKEIKLTKLGRELARKILKQKQKKLPLKMR